MTDIGNCRPPVAGVPPAGAPITGSTSILMSTSNNNGVVGQASSTGFLQPNMNGLSSNYATIASTAVAGVVPSSSAGPVINSSGAMTDQQRKQQTAFIVLPISFRMAAGGPTGASQPQQIQQNSSTTAPVNHDGSVHRIATTTATMKTVNQPNFPQGSPDSFTQKQPLSSDQAVKTAVNWIVQDAKQRQQQQHQDSISQPIYHRNNGKLMGPSMPSPAAIAAMKHANDANSRKFSTSSTMQNEVSKIVLYL